MEDLSILILAFIACALLIGSLTRHLLKKTNFPYTVALLFIGLGVGFLGNWLQGFHPENLLVQINQLAAGVDPKLILFVFLPILIFESAFSMDTHLFRRLFAMITVLAVPGLIVCILLTAALVFWTFPWGWSWPICLMFAALISATDPVAVVALLKEISSRKSLETLIEGESLLNDGTAIVFFTIFYTMATQVSSEPSLSQIGLNFLYVVFTGGFIGVTIGYTTSYWWGRVFNDPMIEITVSIISAFASFMIAEHFHVSGVVAVVACAIVMAGFGRSKVSPEVSSFLHHFWGMLGFIAETIIFLLVGIIISQRVNVQSPSLWLMLGLVYIGIMLARAIAVLVFYPLLKKLRHDFSLAQSGVLIWGGLRGVVGLTLALAVAQDQSFPAALGDQILFLTAGIVVLTITINGTTMLPVIRLFGLDKLPLAKFLTVRRAKLTIEEDLRAYYHDMRHNHLLRGAIWSEVEAATDLDYPIHEQDIRDEGQALLNVKESDLHDAFIKRMLEAEKSHYWQQRQEGVLGTTATRLLSHAVEVALDEGKGVAPRNSLVRYWRLPKLFDKLSQWPLLRRLMLHLAFIRLSIGYEVAIGFLNTQDKMLEYVPTIAPDMEVQEKVIKDIHANKNQTFHHLAHMNKQYPEIISQLKTYSATRKLLYRKRYIIRQLVHSGLLSETETKMMVAHLEDKMHKLSDDVIDKSFQDPKLLMQSHPLFKSLPEEVFLELCLEVEIKTFEADQVIFEQGQSKLGTYYILGGKVDRYETLAGVRTQLDSMKAGDLLGLYPYDMFAYKAVAKNAVEAIFIPSSSMDKLAGQYQPFAKALKEAISKETQS